MKRIVLLGLLLLTSLLLSVVPVTLAYANNNPSETPDVEITPKITIKGPKGRGKPAAPAATGGGCQPFT